MSWTWLYLSPLGQVLEAAAEEEQLHQLARVRATSGSGGVMLEDRLDEAAMLDHRLAVFVVGLGVELRVARDLAARLARDRSRARGSRRSASA